MYEISERNIKASLDKDSSICSYHLCIPHSHECNEYKLYKLVFILWIIKTDVYRKEANYPKLVYFLDLLHLLLLERSNILLQGTEIFFQ